MREKIHIRNFLYKRREMERERRVYINKMIKLYTEENIKEK